MCRLEGLCLGDGDVVVSGEGGVDAWGLGWDGMGNVEQERMLRSKWWEIGMRSMIGE